MIIIIIIIYFIFILFFKQKADYQLGLVGGNHLIL